MNQALPRTAVKVMSFGDDNNHEEMQRVINDELECLSDDGWPIESFTVLATSSGGREIWIVYRRPVS